MNTDKTADTSANAILRDGDGNLRGMRPAVTGSRNTASAAFIKSEAYEFQVSFWRTSQYGNYNEALEQNGVYKGEVCYGYSAFADSMLNALAAATCLDADADNDLMIRLVVDDVDLGDFKLSEAH